MLYVEFKSFVEYHDPALAAADPDEFDDPPTEYYEQFIDAMVDGGFTRLFVEYPVLGRLLVQVIEQWIEAVEEFCHRFRTDRAELCDRFDIEHTTTVVGLTPLADDAHAGGRLPIRVEFDSGDSVVYKPRSVDLAVAFYEILDRLDDHLPIPSFRTATYLPRDGYGWMEWLQHHDPVDEAAVERYYERAGALLCLAYVLELTDCQFENVLVYGEHPMIVDAETMFHPYVTPSDREFPTEVAATAYDSVLLTALLPWSIGDPRNPLDGTERAYLAGFGSGSERVTLSGFRAPRVEAVNTDVMAVGTTEPEIDRTANTVQLDGEDHLPEAYVDTIIDGFERTYDAICDLHDEERFLSEIVEYDRVARCENRLLYRATQRYGDQLHAITAMDPLRDGVRFSAEIDDLAVPFFTGAIESDRYWPVYAAEHEALWNLDFPRFTCRPDGTTVYRDGTPIGVETDGTGYERFVQRLNSMDDENRARQSSLIRRCFATGPVDVLAHQHEESLDGQHEESLDGQYGDSLDGQLDSSGDLPTLSDERLERDAIELFDLVIETAIDAGGDPHGWVSISPHGESTLVLTPVEGGLYSGREGIALTAAALYQTTGEPRYRRFTHETLRPVVEQLDRQTRPFELGGMNGIGSTVYVFGIVGELLDDDQYRSLATDVAREVTSELLDADDIFDVMKGTAGTLLALLACYDRFGDEDVLDRAVACGDRLLDARTSHDGIRSWETLQDGEPTTGFSHGVSGIAYALARLGVTVGDSRYVEAAVEALTVETERYSEERCNWWSHPENAGEAYVDRWCHGRTGAAMARIALGELLDSPELLQRAEAAAEATAENDPHPYDHLCCGNFGRVEFLLEAARNVDSSPAAAAAEHLAAARVAHWEKTGSFSLAGHSDAFVDPTFFGGVSGIVYSLLRLRDPESLPCVLVLE